MVFIKAFSLFSLLLCTSTTSAAKFSNFTDNNVLPTPINSYLRYLTLFGNGTRTYQCDPTTGSDNYTLVDLNYNLYLPDPPIDTEYLVGRRVYLAKKDYYGGDFAFYTKVGAISYWVGKTIKDKMDPSMKTPLDLPAELELVTERSEPKPTQSQLDIGLADYVTRYGAVGGLLPEDQKCTPATQRLIVEGTTYYSFWRRVQ